MEASTTVARPHPHARRVSPRTKICWTVWARVRSRPLCFHTVDVSVRGAKLRPKCDLPVGTPLTLQFVNPTGPPVRVEAMVWREDSDGLGVMFLGGAQPGPDVADRSRAERIGARADLGVDHLDMLVAPERVSSAMRPAAAQRGRAASQSCSGGTRASTWRRL